MRFLGLFIIICSVLSFFRKRHTKIQKDTTDSFWETERRANQTRRRDISGLSYITIPLDKFPIGIHENDTIKECEALLAELSQKKILNLGAQTNTELKLSYGIANLNALTEYEQNFDTLCKTLITYASALMEIGEKKDAENVLEYGIRIGSDSSRNFLLLADIYQDGHRREDMERLIAAAEKLDSLMKPSILEKLHQKLDAC